MSIISEKLLAWAGSKKIELSDEQLNSFEKYAELLTDWNTRVNLTAITEPSEIAEKHFIDSLTVASACNIKHGASIIDVGTGAGFPGIPLKILRDDIDLTLLDSLNKRIVFLDYVCSQISIKAETIHGRAEEMSQTPQYREKFDLAVSRAVANLPALCEYCLPFVKVGGMFVSMKGPDGIQEFEKSQNAISILGGKIKEIKKLKLPNKEERTIIMIEKIKNTPLKYPRRGVKISKQPL